MPAYVAVRLKGHRRIRIETEDAMKSLRLTRANHAVVLPTTPDVRGQLQKIQDYVTFGTVGAPEISQLIRTRGRLEGDKPVTDADVAKGTSYKSIDDFSNAIADGKAKYADLKGVKPIFRLAPPRKGLKSLKRHVGAHGDLGNRGEGIKDLLARMI
jgi:large subunit ribosomal protein L30